MTKTKRLAVIARSDEGATKPAYRQAGNLLFYRLLQTVFVPYAANLYFVQMQKGGFVYILTNKGHTVLYTGVTSNLALRMHQHLEKDIRQSFTFRYNVFKLVYVCAYPTIMEAIAEEKRIKGGSRQKKIHLIESLNPGWEDLWEKEVSRW